MDQSGFAAPRRIRPGIAAIVAILHLSAAAVLVRAFTPDLPARLAEQASVLITIVLPDPPAKNPPEPVAEPPAAPNSVPEPEGAAGAPGKKATPREVVAPKPRVVLAKAPAPQNPSTGLDNRSGAREEGDGTGHSGVGSGTGAGGSGTGSGGGGGIATKAVKIAGDINSAADYPQASRDQRLGTHVIIALTVGVDGRVRKCRIVQPGGDPEADAMTCRFATERFRFRPATNAAGKAVESVYGWKQSWFVPGKGK